MHLNDILHGGQVRGIEAKHLNIRARDASLRQVRLATQEEVVDDNKTGRILPDDPIYEVTSDEPRPSGDEHGSVSQYHLL
ncbi:hypothetical protein GCM10025869_05310 [Homoserinibacter gongjuensis]|uniref:Uncharacterized protein n=1 Tax=Homoserinibacter gongjuensis TaxID=1162968 RepID=A0ABQ6JT58_9MICO|nr:hypothetical protein GCM10025869_05310 [Homoserinibacter gongjuensis]